MFPTRFGTRVSKICLLLHDEMTIDEQWTKVKEMRLPIQSIVHSGGKSLHIKCHIGAGQNAKLYKERVGMLLEYVNRLGFRADTNCRNASRLTRLPGALRDGKRQYLVCGPCGYPDWDSFELCELHHGTAATTTDIQRTEAVSSQGQHDRATATEASCTPEDQALRDELEKEFGDPLTFSSKGTVTMINEPFWAAFVMRKRGLSKVFGIT